MCLSDLELLICTTGVGRTGFAHALNNALSVKLKIINSPTKNATIMQEALHMQRLGKVLCCGPLTKMPACQECRKPSVACPDIVSFM